MNNNYEILRTENNHQTFTSQFKKENELCIKKKRKASIHTTRILKKKESVEKRAIIFLFRIFKKKKDLVVLPSTTNITILEVPPSHLTPPLLSGPRPTKPRPKNFPNKHSVLFVSVKNDN